MLRRFVAPVLLVVTLGSCSYAYEVLAIAQNGRLAFIVSPQSDRHPSCLRLIEVVAEDRAKAKAHAEPGDDASRIGYGTYWFESVDYNDACANHFPITYGASLKGQHQQDGIVKAKELRREVVYILDTTTGATGYGSGRFMIHSNGQIQNLPER